jgi:hypothetical protein
MLNENDDRLSLNEIEKDQIENNNYQFFIRINFGGEIVIYLLLFKQIKKKLSLIFFKKRTSKKSTSKPIWNEKLVFTCLFPSLIRLFKIELCVEDSFGSRVLACEYIDIENISDYTTNDYFLPTLGPSHVHLHTSPQNFETEYNSYGLEQSENSDSSNISKTYDFTNCIACDQSYVCRLFLNVSSSAKSENLMVAPNLDNLNSYNQNKKYFTIFVLISEVNMINLKYSNNLDFHLSIGKINIHNTIFEIYNINICIRY